MAKTKDKPKIILICPNCGWSSRVVVRADGKYKCYHCGYIGDKKDFES